MRTRRILALAAIAALVAAPLALGSSSALAAGTLVTTPQQLTDALTAGDATIELGADIDTLGAAVTVSSPTTLDLGAYSLTSGAVDAQADLTIESTPGTGSLTATAATGSGNAGIRAHGGTITIAGGTVTATGDQASADTGWGAGIGNDNGTSGAAHVTITGGTVVALGGYFAAGIGSSAYSYSPAPVVTITGGTVTATGGYVGAGIGGGYGAGGGTIEIDAGDVTATGGGTWAGGAGIGGGGATDSGDGGTTTILGGHVTATGGASAAGIGGGGFGDPGTIDIAGGTVSAIGSYSAAGIGSGGGASSDQTDGALTIGSTADVTASSAQGYAVGHGGVDGAGFTTTQVDGTLTVDDAVLSDDLGTATIGPAGALAGAGSIGGTSTIVNHGAIRNTTVTAPVEDHSYLISFDASGGSASASQVPVYATTFAEGARSLPTASRETWDFDGWFADGDVNALTASTPLSSSQTVVAQWSPHALAIATSDAAVVGSPMSFSVVDTATDGDVTGSATLLVDGSPASQPVTFATPGAHTVSATVEGNATNELDLDVQPAPTTLTVTGVHDGTVFTNDTVTVSGTSPKGSTVDVLLGGAACQAVSDTAGQWACALTGLQTTPGADLAVSDEVDHLDFAVSVVAPPSIDGVTAGVLTIGVGVPTHVRGSAWPSVDDSSTSVTCAVTSDGTTTTRSVQTDEAGAYDCDLGTLPAGSYRLIVTQSPAWAGDDASDPQPGLTLTVAAAVPPSSPSPSSTPTPTPTHTTTATPPPPPAPPPAPTPSPTPSATTPPPLEWTFDIEGADGDLLPGQTVTIHATGLPPGSTASAELHSTPILLGSAVVPANGRLDLAVTIPDDVAAGQHHVVVTVTPPGGTPSTVEQPVSVRPLPPVITTTPTPAPTALADGGVGAAGSGGGGVLDRSAAAPTSLTDAIPTVLDIVADPVSLAIASAMALAILILFAIPTELLNSTIAANTHRFGRGFTALNRGFDGAVAWLTRATRSQWVPAILMVVITSIVFGFVDPHFGVDAASGRMVLSLAIALLAVTFGASRIAGAILRRFGIAGAIEMKPVMLVFAVLGVIVARILGFSPGFLIGLVIGLELAHHATVRERNRGALVQTLVIVGLGLVGWLGVSAASAVQGDGVPSFWSQLVGDTFSAMTAEGLTAAFIGMLPLGFLEGRDIWLRSKARWAVLFVLVTAAFALLVLPTAASGVEVTDILFWLVVLFGYAIVALAIWAVLRGIAYRAERRERLESMTRHDTVV